MTTKVLSLIIGIWSLPFFDNDNQINKNGDSDSLTIYYVKNSTESIVDIGCDEFIESFGKRVETRIMTDEDSLTKLNELLTQAKFIDEKVNQSISINVRCKMQYVVNKKVIATICIGNRGQIVINDRFTEKSKKLKHFLSGLFPQE